MRALYPRRNNNLTVELFLDESVSPAFFPPTNCTLWPTAPQVDGWLLKTAIRVFAIPDRGFRTRIAIPARTKRLGISLKELRMGQTLGVVLRFAMKVSVQLSTVLNFSNGVQTR